jgi:osmotically-inducible protein OsmY
VIHEVLPGIVAGAPAAFEVTVADGIVTISGTLPSGQVAHTILDAVRHVQGVVAVRDRFSYAADGHVTGR